MINKTYLVLENVGKKSLKDFVEERFSKEGTYQLLDMNTVKHIM